MLLRFRRECLRGSRDNSNRPGSVGARAAGGRDRRDPERRGSPGGRTHRWSSPSGPGAPTSGRPPRAPRHVATHRRPGFRPAHQATSRHTLWKRAHVLPSAGFHSLRREPLPARPPVVEPAEIRRANARCADARSSAPCTVPRRGTPCGSGRTFYHPPASTACAANHYRCARRWSSPSKPGAPTPGCPRASVPPQ